jgi:hypothetical protein
MFKWPYHSPPAAVVVCEMVFYRKGNAPVESPGLRGCKKRDKVSGTVSC